MAVSKDTMTEAFDFEEKSEEAYIDDLKTAIHRTSLKIAQKVNKSALQHMISKQWIPAENASEAEIFFCQKIPKVLSQELLQAICESLGIEPQAPKSDLK